jgi:hypothetical protein
MAIDRAQSFGMKVLKEQPVVNPSFPPLEQFRVTPLLIDLGEVRSFVAWIFLCWIDPTTDFDRDNAVVADIIGLDNGPGTPNRPTTVHHFGPQHFGELAPTDAVPNFQNVFQSTLVQQGRRIRFRLRTFGPDINAGAEAVVVV